jgi:phosphoadenosine phosphosulfate reductase
MRSGEKILSSALVKFAPKIAIAWSGGKDSTAMLHMIRSLNQGKVPIPVFFIDTGLHFPETLEFVRKLEQEWDLNLVRVDDKSTLRQYNATKSKLKKKELASMMKLRSIKKAVRRFKWRALVVGIRWDEHEARASEAYFSVRKKHTRIHPLLHFSEQDIWEYLKVHGIPHHPLYDQGYRSIGERPFTKPVTDQRASERSGRENENAKIMTKLRAQGYF